MQSSVSDSCEGLHPLVKALSEGIRSARGELPELRLLLLILLFLWLLFFFFLTHLFLYLIY